MVYREMPRCPDHDYVPETSLKEEVRRFNRTLKIISLFALLTQVAIIVYVFLR